MPTDEEMKGTFYDRMTKKPEIYLDLVTHLRAQGRGSGDKEPPYVTDEPDRHPFMCSGAIRFEGLKPIQPGCHDVRLGS